MRRLALVVLVLALAGCGAPIASTEPPPDPQTDRIGWEAGYWYNESLGVDDADGLDRAQREAVVSRAMARVERIRELEFRERVPVTVVSRERFGASDAGGSPSAELRAFDNAKFEALFLVGSDDDSIADQETARNRTVGGYYSPGRDAIVVVSDAESPALDGERTLAHELVHGLQDQHFELLEARGRTRDVYNARNGLIEGDATVVERAYMDRCGAEWDCLSPPDSGADGNASGAPDVHLGIYVLQYFPYADGPAFVAHLREAGGWDSVDDAYEEPPGTSTEVIDPAAYPEMEAREVDLPTDPRDGWRRVRPPNRPDHGRLGQSALTAAFAYTLYDDYNRSGVISPRAFLNLNETGGIDRQDPFEYGLAPTRGWAGDRLHAYRRGNETAYVWRLAWESPAAAERFADGYRRLLDHWGGERVEPGTWRLREDSPFDGAVHLAVDGDTTTIAKAPTAADLDDVYRGAR